MDTITTNQLQNELIILRKELLEERRLRLDLERKLEELLNKRNIKKNNSTASSAFAQPASASLALAPPATAPLATIPFKPASLSPAPVNFKSAPVTSKSTLQKTVPLLAPIFKKCLKPFSTVDPIDPPSNKRFRPNSPSDEMSERIITAEKEKNIPPIILNNPSDYKAARQNIISNNCSFSSIQRTDCAKIFATTSDDFRKITHLLDERKFSFHTYTLPEDKPLRVVIRGLNADFTCSEIKEELLKLKFEVDTINQLINSKTKKPMLLFALTLKKSEQNKGIYNIRYLLHQRITVEQQNKPRGILQCHRCQLFGHSAINCRAPPVCVKCAGPHITKECPHGDKIETPICNNCGGNHPASYRGCLKNPNNTSINKNLKSTSKKVIKQTVSANTENSCSYADKLKITPVQTKSTNSLSRDDIVKIFMELNEKMNFISSQLLPSL